MLRGKFLENLAICAKHPELSSEMLTIGMFSTIHLLLDKPIMEILDEMHFSDNIKLVLSGEETSGFSAQCYRAVLKYEQGEWDAAFSAVKDSGITATVLRQAYLDSIRWIKTLKMR
jgi:EAL and modified HD-GYP domain-containing signal transduction protein